MIEIGNLVITFCMSRQSPAFHFHSYERSCKGQLRRRLCYLDFIIVFYIFNAQICFETKYLLEYNSFENLLISLKCLPLPICICHLPLFCFYTKFLPYMQQLVSTYHKFCMGVIDSLLENTLQFFAQHLYKILSLYAIASLDLSQHFRELFTQYQRELYNSLHKPLYNLFFYMQQFVLTCHKICVGVIYPLLENTNLVIRALNNTLSNGSDRVMEVL